VAESCLFCRIVGGEIPAEEVFRTEDVLAFRDISHVAPVHVLVVPLVHHDSLSQLEDAELAGKLLLAAVEAARCENLLETGYRVVLNTGRDAGQSVGHIHAHVLGGRALEWPPG